MRTSWPMLALLITGCGVARTSAVVSTAPAPPTAAIDSSAIDETLLVLSSERVADLKGRGGACAGYGSLLEESLQQGRVKMRPFMWRVDGRLVSGEAQPDGSIVVARHIDPLNVGIRTIDDVIWTLEHEVAHVAFRISNGIDALSDRANEVVRACRS